MNREKTRTALINDGFNRYSLNSKDDLPPWFLDDESKHYKANIPVTKEVVAALRAKMSALDARPIKKIAEAKARKKMRAAQRLDKAMKKAEGVNETSDMTERDKAKQIEKLMQKGMSTKKAKKDIKVVVAKGAHRGLKGRPKGVKGRYVMVDSRMKKEVCIYQFDIFPCPGTKLTLHSGKSTKAERQGEQKAQAVINVLHFHIIFWSCSGLCAVRGVCLSYISLHYHTIQLFMMMKCPFPSASARRLAAAPRQSLPLLKVCYRVIWQAL